MALKEQLLKRIDFFDHLFEENISVGVDIGMYSVKVVEIEESIKGPCVKKSGYKEIARFKRKESEAEEIDLVAGALMDIWQEEKISSRRVRVSISDPSIYIRHINVPRVSEKELAKAVKWQAEKYVPFSIEDAIVDFQILGFNERNAEEQIEIVIVAVEKSVIDKYVSILRAARLSPADIDISPFSVANFYRNNYPIGKEEVLPIVDVGAETTSIIILKGDSLQLARNINLAGKHFTQGVSKGLKVEMAAAEKIKKQFSFGDPGTIPDEEHSRILSAFESTLLELIDKIDHSFAYCERSLFIGKIDKMILCGGGINFDGVGHFLSQKLSLPVVMANPLNFLSVHPKKINEALFEERASQMLSACGKALG